METVFLWIIINNLVNHLHAHDDHDEYITIWNDTMETNNGWTGYHAFQFSSISNKCISSPCHQVVALDGDSWIEKATNIEPYSHVQLQIDVNAIDTEENDGCQIWYNFDNNEYIKYEEFREYTYKNEIIEFPDCSSSNIIYIRLKVVGDAVYDRDICYWDNAILRGTLSRHTPYPTTFSAASFSTKPSSHQSINTSESQNLQQIPDTNADPHDPYHYDSGVPKYYDNITVTLCLVIFIGGAGLCSAVILLTRQIIMRKERKARKERKSKNNGLQSVDVTICPSPLSRNDIITPMHALPIDVNGDKNWNPCVTQLTTMHDNDTVKLHCGETKKCEHRNASLKKGSFVRPSYEVHSESSDDQEDLHLSNVSESDDDDTDTEVDKPLILKE